MAVRKNTVSTKVKSPQHRVTTPRKIVLDTQIGISGIRNFKSLLEKILSRKQLTIDASKLEKIDTSALQLLAAFMLEADKRSIKVNWQSPSARFINSARLLGLVELLKLPAEHVDL
jgi:ABC-type transporter Mla MlaB component